MESRVARIIAGWPFDRVYARGATFSCPGTIFLFGIYAAICFPPGNLSAQTTTTKPSYFPSNTNFDARHVGRSCSALHPGPRHRRVDIQDVRYRSDGWLFTDGRDCTCSELKRRQKQRAKDEAKAKKAPAPAPKAAAAAAEGASPMTDLNPNVSRVRFAPTLY